MPQGPLQAVTATVLGAAAPTRTFVGVDTVGALISAQMPGGQGTSLRTDSVGALIISDDQGDELSTLNITVASAVHVGSGVVGKVSVITPPTVAGSINDTTAPSLASSANAISAIPTTAGAGTVQQLDWPFLNGFVVEPGGGVIAVTYRLTS
jgi:hypothetical protein